MFDIHENPNGRSMRWLAGGLAVFSLVSLIFTVLITIDVWREQEIVDSIIKHLPDSDLAAAEELSGDLRLHGRMALLLVLNIIGTAVALALVLRGYLHSEQSLRDVKVLASDIIASMDAAVITTDRHGSMTSVNAGARELIGLDERAIGQSLDDIDDVHALLSVICREVNATHETVRDQDYVVTTHGHKQTLRTSCTILRNQRKDEIGTVVYVRDVTQRALLEERLRRMERYMGLGSLAAGLQHEIKNPLSAVSLHIQLLRERLAVDQMQPDVHEMLDILHTEVSRISHVLDGFRNYASVRQLGRSPVVIGNLIEKLVRLLRPPAESQGVEIVVNLSEAPRQTVLADSIQLEQVLLNLALNAVAAMPEGGIMTFTVTPQGNSIRVDVTDTGHGIPTEVQSQIFDPYFTTRNEGTGMGLALCDKIIRLHDGSIDFCTGVERDELGGTEFTILLPLEDDE